MNIQTGELRSWDSLTDVEQKSGQWIRVPDGTEGGMARPASLLDSLFPKAAAGSDEARLKGQFDAIMGRKGSFDALGKPR